MKEKVKLVALIIKEIHTDFFHDLIQMLPFSFHSKNQQNVKLAFRTDYINDDPRVQR